MHKMKAFVRFRPITGVARSARRAVATARRCRGRRGPRTERRPAGAGHRHVAWFEPEHHVVEAVAPFFARRFAQMRWSILTPERSVRWDGNDSNSALAHAARMRRRPMPASGSG
jgi:DNA polymerase